MRFRRLSPRGTAAAGGCLPGHCGYGGYPSGRAVPEALSPGCSRGRAVREAFSSGCSRGRAVREAFSSGRCGCGSFPRGTVAPAVSDRADPGPVFRTGLFQRRLLGPASSAQTPCSSGALQPRPLQPASPASAPAASAARASAEGPVQPRLFGPCRHHPVLRSGQLQAWPIRPGSFTPTEPPCHFSPPLSPGPWASPGPVSPGGFRPRRSGPAALLLRRPSTRRAFDGLGTRAVGRASGRREITARLAHGQARPTTRR